MALVGDDPLGCEDRCDCVYWSLLADIDAGVCAGA